MDRYLPDPGEDSRASIVGHHLSPESQVRAVHQIRPDEVGNWLSDSALRVPTIHRTDRASAEDIITHGVQIELGNLDAGWGQGFYSCTLPDRRHGEAEVQVAVRLQRPLMIRDPIRDAEVLETLTARAGLDDFRLAILLAGYDGVVIEYGPSDLVVVAYRNEQVKVVLVGGAHG